MSLFIVFEGIEGCGKTTQIKLLGDFLDSRNIAYTLTREPGGTPIGEAIRKIFLHSDNAAMLPLTELILVTAARVQHIHQVISPALAAGQVVICDRFFTATVAYQGYAGGVNLDLITQSHELFCGGLQPDLTILLDCPVATGLARSRSRNKAAGTEQEEGRFEEKRLAFHERVRQGYHALAARTPDRFMILDADRPVAAVQRDLCAAVTPRLKGQGYAV
jgi:dTMP kinase